MVNVAFELGNQVQEELEYSKNIDSIQYDSLLITGMGGSGISGDVLSLLSNEVSTKSIIVRKSYSIPKKIKETNPFCLFISYSGNTEETLSGLQDAIENNLDWAVISSGGKLIELALENDKEYIKIPEGLQPRAAFGYLTQAVCKILDVVEGTNFLKELKDAGDYLNEMLKAKEDSEIFIEAKKIANQVNKKTSILYGGTELSQLVASRWKTQINENAKSKAFTGTMPEVHHNEILSWDADLKGSKSNFILILLRDDLENSQITKRFDLTKRLLGEKVDIINIKPKSQATTLTKLMELVLLGDLFSLSLASKLKMIPEDIEGIENLKKLLED
ncbi:MAG: bifunctional phosphoglucose/phosphomannose isomerase [Candidatus Actinomarina sp.]